MVIRDYNSRKKLQKNCFIGVIKSTNTTLALCYGLNSSLRLTDFELECSKAKDTYYNYPAKQLPSCATFQSTCWPPILFDFGWLPFSIWRQSFIDRRPDKDLNCFVSINKRSGTLSTSTRSFRFYTTNLTASFFGSKWFFLKKHVFW